MSLGKKFITALAQSGTVSEFLGFGKVDHLFIGNEPQVWAYVSAHIKKYATIPTVATIEAHTQQELMPAEEPPAYYLDLLKERYIELAIKKTAKESTNFLQPGNRDVEKALALMAEGVMDIIGHERSNQVHDFRDAFDLIIATYAQKMKLSDDYGLQLGWPTLDQMSGGIVKGDTVSIVGRPAAGKTWQLLYAAHSGWRKAHNNPEVNQSRLFISMEMDALPIEQRLASMQTHLPFGDLKHANFTTPKIKALKSGLKEIQGYVHPFWVAEGNLAAMVEDVWMLARQLKPGAIFIDGAYLMKHPTERDRFRRVAENANLIKQELAPLCPVVCSWQFAKSAAKKNTKKGEKVTYEDIGYSDAIAQDSSLILGLMQSDGVDTLIKRKVEILKGRNGEVGSFETYWDFKNMNFGEVVEEPLEELKFLG